MTYLPPEEVMDQLDTAIRELDFWFKLVTELKEDKDRLDWLINVFQFPYNAGMLGWKKEMTGRFVHAADEGWNVSAEEARKRIRAAIDAARKSEA